MKKFLILIFTVIFMAMFGMSGDGCSSTDNTVQHAQEQLQSQANDKFGLPAITRFGEKGTLKMIYELRDKADLQTYVYLQSAMTGELVYIGRGVGYPIPYATQYSNPQKQVYHSFSLPQAEPNGLFMPASADGTWQLMVLKNGKVEAEYFEPRIVVLTHKLEAFAQ